MDTFMKIFNRPSPSPTYFMKVGNESFITDCKTHTINIRHVISIENRDKCLSFKVVGNDTIKICEETNKEAYSAILKNLF